MARDPKRALTRRKHGVHGNNKTAETKAKALIAVEDMLANGMTSSQICKSEKMNELGIAPNQATEYVAIVLVLLADLGKGIDREQKRAQLREIMHNTLNKALTYKYVFHNKRGERVEREQPDFNAAGRILELLAHFEGVMEQPKTAASPVANTQVVEQIHNYYYPQLAVSSAPAASTKALAESTGAQPVVIDEPKEMEPVELEDEPAADDDWEPEAVEDDTRE